MPYSIQMMQLSWLTEEVRYNQMKLDLGKMVQKLAKIQLKKKKNLNYQKKFLVFTDF